MIDIVKECEGAQKIGITGHINPDGDCVGSVMALWQFLRKVFPKQQIDVMIEQPLDVFDCIKGVSEIETDYSRDVVYDVMFVVDTVPDRCGEAIKYIETAKKVMTEEHRAALRHLLTFRFKRHSRYNLPSERLKLIEKMNRSRARKLLEG